MLGVRFPLSWIQTVPDQSPEVRADALHEGGTRHRFVWLGVGTSILVMGILLYHLLAPDKESEKLRQFCNGMLNGKHVENVAAKAQELGFDVRELQDTLLITVSGKRLGQSCFLAIVEGKVSNVHSVVTH